MSDALNAELERTGLTLRKLGLHISANARESVPPDVLHKLLNGCGRDDVADHQNLLLSLLENLPDMSSPSSQRPREKHHVSRIPFTAEMREQLNAEFERTGASFGLVCHSVFPTESPQRMKGLINRMKRGDVRTVPKSYWEAIIGFLKSRNTAS